MCELIVTFMPLLISSLLAVSRVLMHTASPQNLLAADESQSLQWCYPARKNSTEALIFSAWITL